MNNNEASSSSRYSSLLNSFVYGDEDLLLEATQAAQQNTLTTVRRVLRAVAVQALQQQLQIKRKQRRRDDRDADAHADWSRIVIESDDIVAVQTFCQQLASLWIQANRSVGNLKVATWIEQIVENESDVLYYRENNDEADQDEDGTQRDSGMNSTAAESMAETTSILRTSASKEPSQQQQQQHFATPYARLRAIRPTPSLRSALQAMDRLGNRRQTYWTGSWGRTIQAAARQIPYRCYKNNAPEQIEIVHASQVDNDNSNKSTSSTKQRKAVDWLLDRKRKSVGRERLPPKRVRRKKKHAATDTDATSSEPPRPPVENGEYRWTYLDIQNSFSESQRRDLDALVVLDAEMQESPPSLAVGALMDVGHFHYYRQMIVDNDEDDEDVLMPHQHGPSAAATPTLIRRWQRRSVLERLGDHVKADTDYGNYAKRASASRVWQTQAKDDMNNNDNNTEERKQHWRDFDLQLVTLEVFDGVERHLLTFETLQVILLDEDEGHAPEGWHDEDNDDEGDDTVLEKG